jgi:glycine cleavage system aminomethyltransferase T
MSRATPGQSLQDLLDGLPDLVDHFANDTRSPAFNAGGAAAAVLTPPAYTNWRDEQRAWSETAVLFQQTHNMPELFIEGPDALRLLQRLGVNTFANFALDRAKQFVACAPSGHAIGDCILYRRGEQSFELVSGMPVLDWVHYHAETGYDVHVVRDNQSTDNPTGRRVRFRFQLDGPLAGTVFAAAVDGEPPSIPFFRTATVSIAGREVLTLRHGMAGYQGVELSGAFDDHDAVLAALIAAGADHGLVQAGTQAYYSTPMSSGWMPYPVPGIYTGDETRGFREWLPATSWEANVNLSGSFRSPSIEDYYATPYDLGYERVVKFDHDFIGREALEKIRPEDRKIKRTLVWNREDVLRVYASQFGDGPRYKAIELPVSYYGLNPFDAVRDGSGRLAGVSCHAGYNDGELLSLARLDPEHAEVGTELVLTWGEPDGGSRKPQVERHEQTEIRVVVALAPYAGAVQKLQRAGLPGRS